ncbi:GGDEF domain-containing protein [Pseudoalteromonas sp. Ld20]|uniref:GGDEF domain-containing protein n=1 Tax=Pseudoalteromonas sp. Ld20 TaxID=649165 RepID=UPI00386CBE8E
MNKTVLIRYASINLNWRYNSQLFINNSKKKAVMRIIHFSFFCVCVVFTPFLFAMGSQHIDFLSVEKTAMAHPNEAIKRLILSQDDKSLPDTQHAYNNTLLARLYLFQGDIDLSKDTFELAYQQLPKTDNWIHGYWLLYRSIFSLEQGQLPQGLRQIKLSQEAFAKANDYEMIVRAISIEGVLLLWQEEYPKSIEIIENAYIEAKTAKMSTTTMLYIYDSLAAYYSTMSLFEQGIQYAEIAAELATNNGDIVNGLPILYTLCITYSRAEQLDLASACYEKMITLSASVKAPRYLFWAPAGKARVALKQKDYTQALQLLYLAKNYVYKVIINPAHIIALNNNFARVFLALEQPEQALEYLHESDKLLANYERPLNNRYMRQTLALKAQSYEQLERFEESSKSLWFYIKLSDEAKETTQQKLEQEARSKFESTQQEIKLQLAEEKLKNQQIALDKLAKEGQLNTAYLVIGLLVIVSMSIFGFNQHRAYVKSQQRANTDPLTGACNRRYILDFIVQQLIDKERFFSVAILDIDHFKQVNDNHGHDIGDQALIGFTTLLQTQLENTACKFARFGGEEFIVVMPDFDLEAAHEFIANLCTCLKSLNLTDKNITLTSSAGVAQRQSGMALNTLLKIADTNLYKAKNTGRDKVCS